MSFFGGGSSSAAPAAPANQQALAVKQQIAQEAAVANARQLVEKLNEHCFERCVPKPGSSLSSGESTCYTQCMEKYMAAWNTVSKQYINRIQKEAGPGGIALQ